MTENGSIVAVEAAGTADRLVTDHGGALDRAIARFGGVRAQWLDLSTGINPWPYPVPALSAEAWTRLPDAAALLAAARGFYGAPADPVAAPGSQSSEQFRDGVAQHATLIVFGAFDVDTDGCRRPYRHRLVCPRVSAS